MNNTEKKLFLVITDSLENNKKGEEKLKEILKELIAIVEQVNVNNIKINSVIEGLLSKNKIGKKEGSQDEKTEIAVWFRGKTNN